MAERTTSAKRFSCLHSTAGSSLPYRLNGNCYHFEFFLVGGSTLNRLGHDLAHHSGSICKMRHNIVQAFWCCGCWTRLLTTELLLCPSSVSGGIYYHACRPREHVAQRKAMYPWTRPEVVMMRMSVVASRDRY